MSTIDIRGIDVGILRAFEALMAERSVSRAAARLFLSQSAVSSSLKRLRQVFADPLFARTPYGVEPTPRALALEPHVQAVLLELGRLAVAGQVFDPAMSDRIFRLIGSDHMSRQVLPGLCRDLAALGSGIRLLWVAANYASLPESALLGDADCGLLPRPRAPADLWADLLYEDSYVLVARHGLFGSAPGVAEYCAAPHIVLGHGRSALDDLVDDLLARAGLHRKVHVAVTGFGQMVEILAHTDHVAIFPARVAQEFGAVLAIHRMPIELPAYGMYLCSALRAKADPAIHWLRGEITGHLRPCRAAA